MRKPSGADFSERAIVSKVERKAGAGHPVLAFPKSYYFWCRKKSVRKPPGADFSGRVIVSGIEKSKHKLSGFDFIIRTYVLF
ncbi:MAG: hypothetical protein K2P27_08160 [Lachnospiraceae bacterium]|nr:hypothetical protein [Lachnospiraceae bacterium]